MTNLKQQITNKYQRSNKSQTSIFNKHQIICALMLICDLCFVFCDFYLVTIELMSLSSIKYPYIVVLRTPATWQFNVFGSMLNLVSLIFFCKEFAFTSEKNLFLIAGILLVLGFLVWNIIRMREGHKVFFNRAYLISALLWIKMPYMEWLFVAFILLAILERQVKFPLEIGFSEKQVVFNTLFKKKYDWSQLDNVVLKDGLLTIDFINNRLLQREVEDEDYEDEVSEEEFNAFCRQQLQKKM